MRKNGTGGKTTAKNIFHKSHFFRFTFYRCSLGITLESSWCANAGRSIYYLHSQFFINPLFAKNTENWKIVQTRWFAMCSFSRLLFSISLTRLLALIFTSSPYPSAVVAFVFLRKQKKHNLQNLFIRKTLSRCNNTKANKSWDGINSHWISFNRAARIRKGKNGVLGYRMLSFYPPFGASCEEKPEVNEWRANFRNHSETQKSHKMGFFALSENQERQRQFSYHFWKKFPPSLSDFFVVHFTALHTQFMVC